MVFSSGRSPGSASITTRVKGIARFAGTGLMLRRRRGSSASRSVVSGEHRRATSNGQTLPQGEAKAPFLQQITGNLWLISGHPATENGGVTASLDQVRAQMKALPGVFAYVVINAPPVGMYNDAVLLGQKADGIVLVLEANSTRRVAAHKAKQALEAANVRVLGTVLNNRTFPIPEKIYRLL